MSHHRVKMPKWPAYVMAAFAAACTYPAITNASGTEAARAADHGPERNPASATARTD